MCVGVCAHICMHTYGCTSVNSLVLILWYGVCCVALLARETLVTACLTLTVLYASNFCIISDPYQCFSSSHDTRAEIVIVEPKRKTPKKLTYCCQCIFMLLQPYKIMVWVVWTVLKCIYACRNIIRERLKVPSTKEFRTEGIRNFAECITSHPRLSLRFSVRVWRAFFKGLETVICSV